MPAFAARSSALTGAGQIGFTIVSLTVSKLIAVLIRYSSWSDVVGRLFREFAVTLAVTIVISSCCFAHPDSDDVLAHSAPRSQAAGGPAFIQASGTHV